MQMYALVEHSKLNHYINKYHISYIKMTAVVNADHVGAPNQVEHIIQSIARLNIDHTPAIHFNNQIIIDATLIRLNKIARFNIDKVLCDATVVNVYDLSLSIVKTYPINLYQDIDNITEFSITLNFDSPTGIINVKFQFANNKCVSFNTTIDWTSDAHKLNVSEIVSDTLDFAMRVINIYNSVAYTVHFDKGITSSIEFQSKFYSDDHIAKEDIAIFAKNMITFVYDN